MHGHMNVKHKNVFKYSEMKDAHDNGTVSWTRPLYYIFISYAMNLSCLCVQKTHSHTHSTHSLSDKNNSFSQHLLTWHQLQH